MSNDSDPATPQRTVQTIALSTVAVLAVLYSLSVAADLVIPLVLAIMLKLMLQPVMHLLSGRLPLPEPLSALLVMLALAAIVVAVGLSIAVPASGWVDKAPAGLRTLQNQVSLLRAPLAAAQNMLQETEHQIVPGAPLESSPAAPATPPAKPPPAASPFDLGSIGISILLGTQQFVGRLFVLVVTLFFMLAAGDTMLRKLVEVTPGLEEKKHIVFIAGEIQDNVAATCSPSPRSISASRCWSASRPGSPASPTRCCGARSPSCSTTSRSSARSSASRWSSWPAC
jgi:predicted PurR-regulated permease PerM